MVEAAATASNFWPVARAVKIVSKFAFTHVTPERPMRRAMSSMISTSKPCSSPFLVYSNGSYSRQLPTVSVPSLRVVAAGIVGAEVGAVVAPDVAPLVAPLVAAVVAAVVGAVVAAVVAAVVGGVVSPSPPLLAHAAPTSESVMT